MSTPTTSELDVTQMMSAVEELVAKRFAEKAAARADLGPPVSRGPQQALTIEEVERLPPVTRHTLVRQIVESLKGQSGTFKVREYKSTQSAHALAGKLRRAGLEARTRGRTVFVVCR